jgi:iturin family lipopeptide synthetase C
MYGPTETTIWSTVRELTGEAALNIGQPVGNTVVYVLDRYGRVQPLGVKGEIYIGGDGLARGYLNNPELTAEKFVGEEIPAGVQLSPRLYKTGDLGRWLPDGNLECLGRLDFQVKIRGYRIELEEIEKHLLSHESVKEAVVLAEGEAENKYLAAYLVAAGELNVSWLRDYLLKKVPMYMLPAEFIQVDRIPQTPNGKVDRKALKKWGGERLTAVKTYAPPDTEMEKQVAGVWQEILDLDRVGREDNFFDLGGTSLKVIMAATRLQVILDREIPVVAMFRYPTVVAMSRFLDLGEGTGETRDRSAARARGKERVKMKRQLKKLDVPGE